MSKIVETIRQAVRGPTLGAPSRDTQAELPVGGDTSTSTSGDVVSGIAGVTHGSTGFNDGRKWLPGVGMNLFGRIFRWVELMGFRESCNIVYPDAQGYVTCYPEEGNNTIIRGSGSASLLVRFDVPISQSNTEVANFGYNKRAFIDPHTLWIYHGGMKIGALSALLPDGVDYPQSTDGLTVVTLARLVDPSAGSGGSSFYRVLGFQHFNQ